MRDTEANQSYKRILQVTKELARIRQTLTTRLDSFDSFWARWISLHVLEGIAGGFLTGELHWTPSNSTLKQKFKKDNYGQLWVSASGLFSRSGWMDWHHLHYGAASMEAVLVRRGRHNHGCGLVRRPVDVLCISEHGPGAVQDLWLLALTGWWVLNSSIG